MWDRCLTTMNGMIFSCDIGGTQEKLLSWLEAFSLDESTIFKELEMPRVFDRL